MSSKQELVKSVSTTKDTAGRRRLLRQVIAGGTVAGGAAMLPASWTRPVVESTVLPAHAQTSPTACSGDPQIRIFDDGSTSTTDDAFNVYIDGSFVLFVPAPANSVIGECLSGIGSGQHTIRVEFVEDIDDPNGNDNTQDGSYGIELLQGLTFVSGPAESGCTSCITFVQTATVRTGGLFPQGASHEYVFNVP